MRALAYDHYGKLDVLAFREVPAPQPGPGEILVRVRAAALNPKDSFVRKGRFRLVSGRSFPKIVGADFAGEVVGTGAGVVGLPAGTAVWGMLDEWTYRRGTVAEQVVVRAHEVGRKPASLSFEEAAALPLVSLTALQALRDLAKVQRGDELLVHGASGGVGTVAIQIGKTLGARVVTTSSAGNASLCASLGADETLDHAAGSPFGATGATRRFRVVFDVFGNLSFDAAKRSLGRDGVFVSTVPSLRILRDTARTLVVGPRARLVIVRSRAADLDTLAGLVARGSLRPVLDRVVPFDEAIRGIEHLETKRSRGKVVVRIA